MGKKNKTPIEIIDFCPKCDSVPIVEKNSGRFMTIRSNECPKHQPAFVKTGMKGIKVPKKFLTTFNEMHVDSALRKSF